MRCCCGLGGGRCWNDAKWGGVLECMKKFCGTAIQKLGDSVTDYISEIRLWFPVRFHFRCVFASFLYIIFRSNLRVFSHLLIFRVFSEIMHLNINRFDIIIFLKRLILNCWLKCLGMWKYISFLFSGWLFTKRSSNFGNYLPRFGTSDWHGWWTFECLCIYR